MKKNIDDLVAAQPATALQVWKNFILIEGGVNYALLNKENSDHLKQKFAKLVENATFKLPSAYVEKSLREHVQWIIGRQIKNAQTTPVGPKSPLERAAQLMSTITMKLFKITDLLKQVEKAPEATVMTLSGNLSLDINTCKATIAELKKLYADNQDNPQLIVQLNVLRKQKNIDKDAIIEKDWMMRKLQLKTYKPRTPLFLCWKNNLLKNITLPLLQTIGKNLSEPS